MPDSADKRSPASSFKSSKDQELMRLAVFRNPFFENLDDDQITMWVNIAQLQTFGPNQPVILEGCVDGVEPPLLDEKPTESVSPYNDDAYVEADEEGELETIENYIYVQTEDAGLMEHQEEGQSVEPTLETPERQNKAQEEVAAEPVEDYSEATIPERSSEYTVTQPPPPYSGIPRSIYIIRKGTAKVIYQRDNVQTAVLGPGQLFGEGGFLFGRQHSASIVVSNEEPLECFVVTISDFCRYVLTASDSKRKLFEQYARMDDDDDKPYMWWDDFVEATTELQVESNATVPERLHDSLLSLQIVNTMLNQGPLDNAGQQTSSNNRQPKLFLEDFLFYQMLIARPDSEIDIAFLLMDEKQTGQIFLEDLAKFLRPVFPELDYTANFFQRYFGRDGSRSIRQQHFSQFFVDLQREMGKQAFLRKANGTGYVDPPTFARILKESSGWRLPQGVLDRLDTVYSDSSGTHDQHLSYGEFMAFQEVLGNLHLICNLIDRAQEVKQGPISQSDFKVVNQALGLGGRFSRGQVEIAFRLFDLDGDGYVTYDDAVNVCGAIYTSRLVPAKGQGDRLVLKPARDHQQDEEEKSVEDVVPKMLFRERFKAWMIDFGTATVVGGVAAGILYPIDLVKTRLMNQPFGASKLYKNSRDCLLQAYRMEGFVGLYRGIPAVLLGFPPERAIKLKVHDLMLNAFSDGARVKPAHPDLWLETLAGAGAGACQLLVANPVEIVKIRMQMQGETSRLLRDMGTTAYKSPNMLGVIKTLRFPGLYIGAAACLLRDVPFSAMYFPSYAMFKQILVQHNNHDEPSAGDLLLAGTLAGIPAAVLTTPADVIKSRLQYIPRPGEGSYTGIQDCAKELYKVEGLNGFFRGVSMRTLRIAPQFGLTLTVYEGLTRLVGVSGTRPPTSVPVDAPECRSAFSGLFG